jgi:hypothetical protein
MEVITQHIMEGRSGMFDPDEVTSWAKWVNGDAFGELDNGYDDEWYLSPYQVKLENETVEDAVRWFQSLPLSQRMARLNPGHRPYRQVILWTRSRAPWPNQLGDGPKNVDQMKMVRRWCLAKHHQQGKLSPRSAIGDYEKWWNESRHKRSKRIQKAGDNILFSAKRLSKRLNQLSLSSLEAQRLLELTEKQEIQWPEALDKYKPSTAVERDTVQDWIFNNERGIMRHVRGRFCGQYRY